MSTPNRHASTLAFSLLGVLACSPGATPGEDPPPQVDPVPDESVQAPCPPDQPPPTSELCPPTRQIAHLPDLKGCPLPEEGSGWVVDELFGGESPPAAMKNYCRYVWAGEGEPTELPAGVEGRTSADCRMLVQSGPFEQVLGRSYQQTFLAGVRALPRDTLMLGQGHPVDIAVIDTAPANTLAGQAAHGPAIAAIVAAVASGCMRQTGSCSRSVSTVLGLPQVVGGVANTDLGGFFGYQSDLAQGIFTAVQQWDQNQGDPQRYRSHRLIINLSVGWEPNVGQATEASAAVEQAIRLARCRGALVIAASGNQPPSSCVDQPTGPGAWADKAITPDECGKLGSAPFAGTQHSLVYAATPLDWQQRNLVDFRPGSNASLATLGFAATVEVEDERGTRTYGPLSGSSVASATVSGIAALVWSNFPELSADEVMDILYASGTPRTLDGRVVTADFMTGKPEQRVVTACAALVHACDELVRRPSSTAGLLDADQCDEVQRSCEESYSDKAPTLESTWWTDSGQALDELAGLEIMHMSAPTMNAHKCAHCGAADSSWLPISTPGLAIADPWVLPQPEKPPCPMCQIKDDDIYLSLDPAYADSSLSNVIVKLFDATGASETRNYGALHLTPTSLLVLEDPELRQVGATGAPPVSASVTMVFTTLTASNQIPVGP